MPTIKVLQVHKKFYRDEIQDYALADFEGIKRVKTLQALYGNDAFKASLHIRVREVLSRILPPQDCLWYRPSDNTRKKILYFYKDWTSAD